MLDSGLKLAASFPWTTLSLAVVIAAGAILMLMPVARHAGWVDKPDARKVHEGEVPLVGGWAVLLAMVMLQLAGPGGSAAPAGYWIGALLLFVVALIDDRHPIRARYRFMVQFAAAVAGISMDGQVLTDIGNLLGTGTISAWWLMGPVSVLGTVAVVNAVNFTDGADGLCGGLSFIGFFWFLVSVSIAGSLAVAAGDAAADHAASLLPLAAAAMGGLAGFLLFNMRLPGRRKAAVFMGDSGSMLVGFTLAWFAIHVTSAYGASSVSPIVCLWIMAVPLADSASCFLRRILARETPMKADLKHLHHLLMRCGMPVATAVATIHVGAFACGLFGVGGWWLGMSEPAMFFAFVVALLGFMAVTIRAWTYFDAQARRGIAPDDALINRAVHQRPAP
jgi:UDP-GlcNAc:undecaprenyl-phosphate GlcNAc-1-phosphate transferase